MPDIMSIRAAIAQHLEQIDAEAAILRNTLAALGGAPVAATQATQPAPEPKPRQRRRRSAAAERNREQARRALQRNPQITGVEFSRRSGLSLSQSHLLLRQLRAEAQAAGER